MCNFLTNYFFFLYLGDKCAIITRKVVPATVLFLLCAVFCVFFFRSLSHSRYASNGHPTLIVYSKLAIKQNVINLPLLITFRIYFSQVSLTRSRSRFYVAPASNMDRVEWCDGFPGFVVATCGFWYRTPIYIRLHQASSSPHNARAHRK